MQARKLILTVAAIAALAAPAAALAASDDASTTIRYLSPKTGKYQIVVVNTSNVGFIKTFNWVPPQGLTITALTKTVGGTCRLAQNVISCSGGKFGIAPPRCTCIPGGSMTVTFTAKGYEPTWNGQYWTWHGLTSQTVITSMDPVPYPIPSYAGGELDIPICAPGTQWTDEHPCYVE